MWFERKKKFLEGVALSTEKLTDRQLEDVLKNYSEAPSQIHKIEIAELSPEQNILISKTLLYIVQRFNLFLLSPVKLQNDLTILGFSSKQSEILTEFYSEANREIIKSLKSEDTENETDIMWDIKTTLRDDLADKCKKPQARLCLKKSGEGFIEDLTHSELLTLFDDFEQIQRELDILTLNQ